MNRLIRTTQLLLAGVAAVISAPFAAAQGDHAHVHGIGTLQVAVEGERLTLEFASPLDNLVGFERAPRTDKEKAAVRQMLDRLQKPEDLIVPSPEARCTRTSVKVDAPVLDAQRAADASASKAGAPAAKDKEKRAGKSEKSEHAGLEAHVVFRCEQPQNLKGLRVALFDAFPKLRRVDAQVAGAKKQTALKLTTRSRNLPL